MNTLDERFLTVHPRTAAWWKQREQCLRCRHVRHVPPQMMCSAVPWARGDASCIQARDVGQACGPEAVLFEVAA